MLFSRVSETDDPVTAEDPAEQGACSIIRILFSKQAKKLDLMAQPGTENPSTTTRFLRKECTYAGSWAQHHIKGYFCWTIKL